MPAWCQNVVKVSGSKKDVKQFVDLMTERFDYERVIPRPKELDKTTCPVKILTQAEYEEQEESNKKVTDEGGGGRLMYGITKEMQEEFIRRFGCDNWYVWNNHNWGMKWNTDPDDTYFCVKDGYVEWIFWSPWSPPYIVCHKLRELFPGVNMSWWYGVDETDGYL